MGVATQNKNTLSKVIKKVETAITKAPDWIVLVAIGGIAYLVIKKFRLL